MVIDLIKELIEGGFVGQIVIGTLVWGVITFLIIQQAPVDNRLYDAGFIVLGYLFHVGQMAGQTRLRVKAQRIADNC